MEIAIMWHVRKKEAIYQLERELQWLIKMAAVNPERYIPKLKNWIEAHRTNIKFIRVAKSELTPDEFLDLYIKAIKKLGDGDENSQTEAKKI